MATVNFLYRSQKISEFLTCRLQFRKWNEDGRHKDVFLDGKTNRIISKADWKTYTINKHKKSKLLEVINLKNKIESELNELSNFILSEFRIENHEHHQKKWLQKKLDQFYKEAVDDAETKSIPKLLVPFMEDFLKINKYKENTLKNNKTVISKLKGFELHNDKKILISEIDYDFKDEILEYFEMKNYSPSTIERDFGTIKTFCTYARKKGAILNLGFEDFKYKVGENDVIHPVLTLKELENISNLQNLPDHLDNARDWLIISCFSAQRISDFLDFTSKSIRIEKSIRLIEFKQKKTGKLMSIPILPQVQKILDKHAGEFPRKISDQKYNDYIKIVCEKADIKNKITGYKVISDNDSKEKRRVKGEYPKFELVSSHIGRRSFSTNFYGQIPTSDLMYLTGHTRESNFLRYINKSNSDRAHDIAKRFNSLSSL